MNQPNANCLTFAHRFGQLALSLIGVSLIALPQATIAQEYAGCFWIDERGKRIDLSEFCPLPIVPDAETTENPAAAVPGTNPNSISVPIIRRDAGVPVVSVLFDGRPYEMLVDTGASIIVIPARMGSELGLQTTGSMFVTTASASRVQFNVAQVASVQLGSLVMNNLDVAIGSDDALEIGLLGQNFFSQYDLTIRQDTIELTHRTSP